MLTTAAFRPELASAIAQGDPSAMLKGVAATAALWFSLAGYSIAQRASLGAIHCAAGRDPEQRALLAAAMDLCALLELSPQGREALAKFAAKPVLEQSKAE